MSKALRCVAGGMALSMVLVGQVSRAETIYVDPQPATVSGDPIILIVPFRKVVQSKGELPSKAGSTQKTQNIVLAQKDMAYQQDSFDETLVLPIIQAVPKEPATGKSSSGNISPAPSLLNTPPVPAQRAPAEKGSGSGYGRPLGVHPSVGSAAMPTPVATTRENILVVFAPLPMPALPALPTLVLPAMSYVPLGIPPIAAEQVLGRVLPPKPAASWLVTPQRQTTTSFRRVVDRLSNLDYSEAPVPSKEAARGDASPPITPDQVTPLFSSKEEKAVDPYGYYINQHSEDASQSATQ